METFTLLFFVLMLLVAGLLVTLPLRRDLTARERDRLYSRRGPAPAHARAAQGAPHAPLQHHAHKSPARPL